MKSRQIKGNIEFKETQQFRRGWILLLILFPVLLMTGLALSLSTKEEMKSAGAIVPLAVAMAMNLVLFLLYMIARLEIAVTESTVYYRWTPFMKKFKEILLSDVERVYERRSPFLQLGYKRLSLRYGRINNTGTSRGLQFVLKSGRKIFISADKIKGFERALEKIIPVSTK